MSDVESTPQEEAFRWAVEELSELKSRVIMASFGDPYKLYDYPYMRTYLNCYDNSANTQRAYVRLLTGEIKARGKSPISFDGFFARETD